MLVAMVRTLTAPRLAVLAALLTALSACTTTTNGSGALQAGAPAPSAAPSNLPTEASATQSPTATPTPTPSVTLHPAPSSPLRSATVHAASGRTYVIDVWAEAHVPTCADHAHGPPMIEYLTAHPCTGLTRLLATTKVDGKRVGFAQSSLGFIGVAPASYQTAGDFVKLIEQDGTGNINDLLREGYRLPSGPTSVPSPDAFSALAQDAGVVVVDAWYLDTATPTNDPALIKMAQDIYLQY
jgi:hypothetical protein